MMKIEQTLQEICKTSIPRCLKDDLAKIKQIDAKLQGKSFILKV